MGTATYQKYLLHRLRRRRRLALFHLYVATGFAGAAGLAVLARLEFVEVRHKVLEVDAITVATGGFVLIVHILWQAGNAHNNR